MFDRLLMLDMLKAQGGMGIVSHWTFWTTNP